MTIQDYLEGLQEYYFPNGEEEDFSELIDELIENSKGDILHD